MSAVLSPTTPFSLAGQRCPRGYAASPVRSSMVSTQPASMPRFSMQQALSQPPVSYAGSYTAAPPVSVAAPLSVPMATRSTSPIQPMRSPLRLPMSTSSPVLERRSSPMEASGAGSVSMRSSISGSPSAIPTTGMQSPMRSRAGTWPGTPVKASMSPVVTPATTMYPTSPASTIRSRAASPMVPFRGTPVAASLSNSPVSPQLSNGFGTLTSFTSSPGALGGQRTKYGELLKGMLGSDVVTCGWAGDPAANMKPRLMKNLQEAKAAGRPFSHVVILAGTNDLREGRYPDAIVQSLSQLHALCKQHGARVVAVTVPRLGARDSAMIPLTDRRAVVNNHIRQWAATGGVLLADLDAAFEAGGPQVYPALFSDNCHFSCSGYQMLAEAVRNAFAGDVSSFRASPAPVQPMFIF
eukprot:TRINITY_DN19181_c0_g1_i3.p1 TRINITY_DN19181_c0_g1~~TRINITY_DN19181_c0_g1_i3.p1  ORF type:complete len:410 (+),score=51.60 TRINITY_DN19181_c0_g1_i3:66-1295(+)